MLSYDKFFNAMEDIFAAFGKKTPEDKIIKAIYKRIQALPDGFMDFALKYFEDQEKLPQNIGRHMFRELWPQYLDRHPELVARDQYSCCPNCHPDIPGARKVWKPEIILGEQSYTSTFIRCICGNAPNPNNDPVLTDEQLLKMGWRLDNPFEGQYPSIPYGWEKVIGHQDEMRPAHKAYLAEQEGLEPEEIEQKYARIPF